MHLIQAAAALKHLQHNEMAQNRYRCKADHGLCKFFIVPLISMSYNNLYHQMLSPMLFAQSNNKLELESYADYAF